MYDGTTFGYSSSRIVPEYYRTWVRLYLQLFVGGIMSYLHYLFLFMYGGVQRILCFVFVLFVIVLCTLERTKGQTMIYKTLHRKLKID
jgi:hypothetical protein